MHTYTHTYIHTHTHTHTHLWEIKISKKEIEEMMKLNERKAIRSDGVSRYTLKECKQKMAEPIHDIIECSIKTGKVPTE